MKAENTNNGAADAPGTPPVDDMDRKLGFTNKRTEAWWKLREALDPSRAGGSGIVLPDDQELLSDLTSVRFSAVQHRGVMCIKAETKGEMVKRLGRSPDKGDAVGWAGVAPIIPQL